MVIEAPGDQIRSDETSSPEKQGRRESAELIADTSCCCHPRAMTIYLF
jgi:hypothetical protein